MLNDLYVVNEKGQMEINFDALELVTDKFFVETLQDDITNGFEVVSFKETYHSVIVVVADKNTAYFYTFVKQLGTWELLIVGHEMVSHLLSLWGASND